MQTPAVLHLTSLLCNSQSLRRKNSGEGGGKEDDLLIVILLRNGARVVAARLSRLLIFGFLY